MLKAWDAPGGAECLGPGMRHRKNGRPQEGSQAETVAGFQLLPPTLPNQAVPQDSQTGTGRGIFL